MYAKYSGGITVLREYRTKEKYYLISVTASDKPDLGLEELSSLNVKSRFQVFEKAGTETNEIERSPSQIAVKRSPSILSKLAKWVIHRFGRVTYVIQLVVSFSWPHSLLSCSNGHIRWHRGLRRWFSAVTQIRFHQLDTTRTLWLQPLDVFLGTLIIF